MPSTMSDSEIVLKRLAVALRTEWESFVELALMRLSDGPGDLNYELLSERFNVGQDSLKRRVEAIRHAGTLGYSADEIKALGQEKVLSQFIKSRRQEKYSETVMLKWMVPGSQRELIHQQEGRVKKILGLVTSEQFWDFMLSVLRNATDEEIRASAGEQDAEGHKER